MEEKKYYFSADLVRAVAIVGVVIIHVFTEVVNGPKVFLTPIWWFANFVDSAARVSVPLFVMLSGFLLLHGEKKYSALEFLKRRISKIGIPLLIWPFLFYAWKLYSNHLPFNQQKFIIDYISINTYYHLYFLYLITGLYLITPMLKTYMTNASKENKTYMVVLFFLSSLCAIFIKYFFHIGLNYGTIFTISIPYIAYYLAGDYVRNITLSKKQILAFLLAIFFLIIAISLGNVWHMKIIHWNINTQLRNGNFDRYFYDHLSPPVAALSIVVFILLLNLPKHLPNLNKGIFKKFVSQLSIASFGIFIIHPLILDLLNKYGHWGVNQLPEPVWFFLIIKTVLIILASYVITKIIQKIPLVNLLLGS